MNQFLAGFATVSATMLTITVKKNRAVACDELEEIFGINSSANFVHESNSGEPLEKWKCEKIAEKRAWLQLPWYKQLKSPPIHCLADLRSPI